MSAFNGEPLAEPKHDGSVLSIVEMKGMVRHHQADYRWEGVDVHPYKEEGTHFRNVTRQTLWKGEGNLPVEFRYFEVGAGGHSTLERHDHQHAVMIIRGGGEVLVGDTVSPIGLFDMVHIPPMTWHQFRATGDEPLGFLCVVSAERDRPQRPDDAQVAEFVQAAAEFVRR
jgi:mannose-6-phosphate isomerase-like protein (cupin superfamily)